MVSKYQFRSWSEDTGQEEQKEQVKTYRPGQLIVREGEPGGGLLFIKSGKVEIFKTIDGVEHPIVQMGPGEIIGNMTVISVSARTASARALAETVVVKFSHQKVKAMADGLPSWGRAMIKELSERLRVTTTKFVETNHILEIVSTRDTAVSLLLRLTRVFSFIAREQLGKMKDKTPGARVDSEVIAEISMLTGIDQRVCKKAVELMEKRGLIGSADHLHALDISRMATVIRFTRTLLKSSEPIRVVDSDLNQMMLVAKILIDKLADQKFQGTIEQMAKHSNQDGQFITLDAASVCAKSGLVDLKPDGQLEFFPLHLLGKVLTLLLLSDLDKVLQT